MAQTLSMRLMKVYQQNGCLLPNLLALVRLEIQAAATGTTLFRENNICTFMLTTYTKEIASASGMKNENE
jgi:hypothetical protein